MYFCLVNKVDAMLINRVVSDEILTTAFYLTASMFLKFQNMHRVLWDGLNNKVCQGNSFCYGKESASPIIKTRPHMRKDKFKVISLNFPKNERHPTYFSKKKEKPIPLKIATFSFVKTFQQKNK